MLGRTCKASCSGLSTMICSPAGSQRIIWWFSGRSSRLPPARQLFRQPWTKNEDIRIKFCEKGGLRLGLRFLRGQRVLSFCGCRFLNIFGAAIARTWTYCGVGRITHLGVRLVGRNRVEMSMVLTVGRRIEVSHGVMMDREGRRTKYKMVEKGQCRRRKSYKL